MDMGARMEAQDSPIVSLTDTRIQPEGAEHPYPRKAGNATLIYRAPNVVTTIFHGLFIIIADMTYDARPPAPSLHGVTEHDHAEWRGKERSGCEKEAFHYTQTGYLFDIATHPSIDYHL